MPPAAATADTTTTEAILPGLVFGLIPLEAINRYTAPTITQFKLQTNMLTASKCLIKSVLAYAPRASIGYPITRTKSPSVPISKNIRSSISNSFEIR